MDNKDETQALLDQLAYECTQCIQFMRHSSRAHKMLMAAKALLESISQYKAHRPKSFLRNGNDGSISARSESNDGDIIKGSQSITK